MNASVQEMVEAFLHHADGALPAGYQAVLYGSAARGDWVEGMSDINLLLIVAPLGPTELRAIGSAMRSVAEDWQTPPLLLSPEEWGRAGDVFPIEMTDMSYARKVLRGRDPLEGLQPHPTQLRVALERELRTRVVRLRQGYALCADDPEALGSLAKRTLSTVQTMARATLVLIGRPVPPESVQVVRAFAEVTGAQVAPLVEVAAHWRDAGWSCSADLFERFLDSLSMAVEYIDQHVPGAR